MGYMRIKRFSIFLFLSVLLLGFQNCSVVNRPGGNERGGIQFEAAGNGDGYAGMRIDGPTSMQPGDSAEVKVVGGTPPFTMNVTGQGTLQIVDDATFLYSVGANAVPGK